MMKCPNCGKFMKRISELGMDGWKCSDCDWYVDDEGGIEGMVKIPFVGEVDLYYIDNIHQEG